MGKGSHGGFGGTAGGTSAPHTFADNLASLERKYPLSPSGYFGTKGQGRSFVRHISSDTPVATANDFYNTATKNSVSERDIGGKGKMATLRDGTTVSIREVSSSDGSPAVEIKISSPGRVKDQKIHFVKEKEQ